MVKDLIRPAVLEIDSSSVVTVWSPMAEVVFGVPEAEAVGHPVQELATWHFSDRAQAIYCSLSVGDVWVFHHSVTTLAGKELVLKTVSSMTADPGRAPGALLCSIPVDPSTKTDVDSTMPIRSIQGDTERVLFCEDAQLITCVGPPGRRFVGYHRLDLVGRSVSDFVHPDDCPAWEETWSWATFSPRRTQSAVIRWRRADRGWQWMELNATNFLAEPGIDSVVIHCRELDDQMRPLVR